MKKILAKRVSAYKITDKLQDVPAMLDAEGVQFVAIDTNDWSADFPYTPKAEFRIAHTGKSIVINYRVEEDTVRAVAADNGNVWEDSCCEFFSIPAGDGVYYNIECNCAGQMLIGCGKERENRERATQEVLDTVKRWSTLGREPFEEKDAPRQWQMVLIVPVTAFYNHHVSDLSGITIRANFYKCGDKLRKVHFLSWNPISLPKPDFHCPDFFGEVSFEQ